MSWCICGKLKKERYISIIEVDDTFNVKKKLEKIKGKQGTITYVKQ